MFNVLSCLTTEHDPRLVGFAAWLCLLSCLTAMMLLRRASLAAGVSRWIWLSSAGMAGGFGIWATHFVAMLAYDPQIVIGYEPALTLLSLAISIGTTFAAVTCATCLSRRPGLVAAGILFGLGVSTMHFVGMMAIEFPGSVAWNVDFVWSAVAVAILLSVAAFFAILSGPASHRRVATASGLLTLAIVCMHFTAMAGVSLVPILGAAAPETMMSPVVMVIMIAAVALSLLFSGFTAALFAIRADGAKAASENNFRLLVQGVTDYAIYMLDPGGRVSNWNPGAQRFKGYRAEEIVGEHFAVFYSAEERRAGKPQQALKTALSEGKFESEGWRYRKDGTSFWASVVIDPIHDENGVHVGFAKITRDCTEQMISASRLQQASNNLTIALNNMANGLCLYDADERMVLHNDRMVEILGTPADVVMVGKTFRELCHARYDEDIHGSDSAEAFYQQHRLLFTNPAGGEFIGSIANGRVVRTIHRPTGAGFFVTTIEDITERVRSEEKILHLARHDALTGLPNRRQFVENLDAALASAPAKVAAVCIDLDAFKDINDTFGHAVGDVVLCTLSDRMRDILHDDEFVGRFGGDEFVAFKPYVNDQDLDDFISRLSRALSVRVPIEQTEITTSASLGIAIYPSDATDREKLLSNADMAMYRSKASLEETISFYEADMDDAARERRAMARDIWKAIAEKQFFLTYQVQKSLRTQEITGYEVLLRWRHPVHGLISPAVFVPIAEECGAISVIGDWVLEQACRDAASWPFAYKIAVNLSPLQLGNIALIEKVRTILTATGLSPARLELEVTESAIIADKVRALHILRQIKAFGVTIAIDDFGTGYSSFETLRAFPFDKIKLDRSFVNELESRQSKAFVRAIVTLGKSLDVCILAEGVETHEQLEILIAENCDEVQGFLFGRPSTFQELAEADLDMTRKTA